jgi:signal transduction histidine kinase
MKSRGSHVRTKIVALLLSLAALWGFAAYVTLQDGLNLLWVSTLDHKVGRPTDVLITSLQEERRLSLVYLGSDRAEGRAELAAARQRTDAAAAGLAASVQGTWVRWAASAAAEQRVATILGRVADLGRTRASVDVGADDRLRVARAYTGIIDSGFLVYESMTQFADEDIAAQGRTLVHLTRSRDLLAQEDALLSGVLAAGGFTAAEAQEFTRIVGAQRAYYADDVARLIPEDRDRFVQFQNGQAHRRFTAMENQIMERALVGEAPGIDIATWRQVMDSVLADIRILELSLTDATVARAQPAAVWTIVRLALAGGLGLIAVIASIVVSITTARDLVKQLVRLRNAALELAAYRLPRVVDRLQQGERVDVATEAPPLDFGDDEIGQVGQAFNIVQETAVRVAVEQAELRRSVRDVFLSLARRSQAMLHRQLNLLDSMERRTTDAEELAELFRVDHLATRMRRNAENLIVLSGAVAGRAWRRPVPMIDVLRGALAEVEDYTRVTVLPVGPASLTGRAVGDVIHLLAELIENAVSFSPPQTVVRVGGSIVGNGFAVEIEDRGLGMSDEERELANEQLRTPPEFKLTSTARLGLYVVGKLAERHGVRVRLTESPYGGTTAIVLLPASLITDEADGEFDTDPGRALAAIGAGPRPGPRHLAEGTAEIAPTPAARRHRRSTRPVDKATPISPAPTGSNPGLASDTEPLPVRRPEATVFTPSGLPFRTKDGDPDPLAEASPDGSAPSPARTPEDTRTRMSRYRSETLRGRDDAARLTDNGPPPPELIIPKQDSHGSDEGR